MYHRKRYIVVPCGKRAGASVVLEDEGVGDRRLQNLKVSWGRKWKFHVEENRERVMDVQLPRNEACVELQRVASPLRPPGAHGGIKQVMTWSWKSGWFFFFNVSDRGTKRKTELSTFKGTALNGVLELSLYGEQRPWKEATVCYKEEISENAWVAQRGEGQGSCSEGSWVKESEVGC